MGRWGDDILGAFVALGGEALYEDLYKSVSQIRSDAPTLTWRNTARLTVQEHSKDSKAYKQQRGIHLFNHLGRVAGDCRMKQGQTDQHFLQSWLKVTPLIPKM